VGQRGSPPILTAAIKGNGDVVRAILAFGADPNQINRDRDSPLHAAVKGGHADATYALLGELPYDAFSEKTYNTSPGFH
jgi:ankyrin repeat protein